MMKRICLLLLLAYVGFSPTFAYDFSAVCSSGQTLYYEISGPSTVTVTCPSTQSWEGYTMPSGVMIIPETVEYGGISYTVTSIGDYAFYYCTGLTGITIPNTVLLIGAYSFNHCTGITNLTIPNSVVDIGVWSFGYCDAVSSVTIGSSVSIIRQNAFPTPLQSIISLNPVAPQWDSNPFQWNDPSTPIYIPAGSLASYQGSWWKFSNFIEIYDTNDPLVLIVEDFENTELNTLPNGWISSPAHLDHPDYCQPNPMVVEITDEWNMSKAIVLDGCYDQWFVLPELSTQDTHNLQLKFDMATNCLYNYQYLEVGTLSNRNDISTFTAIQTLSNSVDQVKERKSVIIPGGTSNIAVKYYNNASSCSMVLDNFCIIIDTNTLDLCQITVKLYDDYGDGWNGNYLSLYQGDILLANLTIDNGFYYETSMSVFSDSIRLVWSEGGWPNECSFSIFSAYGTELFSMHGMGGYSGNIGTVINEGCQTDTSLYDGSDVCTYTAEMYSRNSGARYRGWISAMHGNTTIANCGSEIWGENEGYSSSGSFTTHWDSISFVWHNGSADGGDLVVIKDQWGATRYSGHVSVVSYFSNGSSWSESTLHLLDGMGNDHIVTDTTLFDVQCLDSSDIHHISIQSNQYGTVSVNNTWNNSDWEYVHDGTVVTITAIPNTNAELQYLKVNGVEVSVPYTMTITSDVSIEAAFFYNLPELHVTNLSCSDFVSGHDFSVSWTVQNDGNAATPIGTTWQDRLYLSTVPYLDGNSIDEAELIGSWQNMSALGTGENYTRTITSTLAERHGTGTYYLIVVTDANYAYEIEWPDSTMPATYSPPPFVRARSFYWSDYENVPEISEQGTYAYDYWNGETYLHDNFNVKTVQVDLPPLPDLEVTNIVHPTNFYSGTQVSVTATITNTGEALTLSSGWRDVLYISSSPESSTSKLQLASVWHDASSTLAPDSSYQVTFTGTVPLSWYGEAWFFITTDPDDNEYEHVGNDNNTSRSEAVNIILTPPADLVVSNVTVPSVASNQMPFAISYSVSNNGLGSPDVNTWVDRVYLSTTPTLPRMQFENGGWYYDYNSWEEYSYNSIDDTVNWCYLIETVNHVNGLSAGNTYTINREYTFPSFITRADTFYIVVITDANNNVFEYQSEDNNTTASNASIISFFFPDLVIDTVVVPDSIDNSNDFTISYTVSNHGLGKTESLWSDRIAISGNQLAIVTHYDPLMPGESYTDYRICSLPSSYSGSTSLDVTVWADYYNEVDEKTAEDNNSRTSYTYATIYKPDFYLSDILIPDTIVVNHSVDLSFTIHNDGQKQFFGGLYYTIYYSVDSVLSYEWGYPTNASWLSEPYSYTTLAVGESQTFTQTLQFPGDIADGDYYIFIVVNPYGSVSEVDHQNNTLRGGTYHLCHRPLPDLTLCNVVFPDTLQAGQEATITFDVVNLGETTVVGAADLLSSRCITYLSAAGAWCPVQSQSSPLQAGSITIAVGDTLHYSQTVLIPPTAAGTASFYLKVDAANNIMELNEENNSVAHTCYVQSIGFDIDIASIDAPNSFITGDTLTLSWTVNLTDATAIYNHNAHGMTDASGHYGYLNWSNPSSGTLWNDRLYLSSDNTASSDDILLGNIALNQSLFDGDGYTISVTAVMPHNLTGNLYLIATADQEANIVENNRTNNTLTRTITATLAPMPNLRVTAFTMDDTVTQRQGCMIHYTVVNDGNGDIVGGTWTDKFYCGTSLIATVLHDAPLAAGATYSDSVEMVIPSNILGNYTLSAVTDADNSVYEHNNENDNSFTRPILVLQAPPCDLIVTNVEASQNAIVGSSISVNWTVQNIGDNVVSGYVKDGIYLSFDTVFDNSDVMIGSLIYYNSFGVYGSSQHTLDCSVQGVTAGDYHVLVRTNIMRAFNEVSFDNNVCASVATTEVALPTLAIGQAEQLTIASGGHAYYRLVVGQEYTGQTLSVTLSTGVDNSFNGLYLSYESMPSAARSGYGVSTPYARNQQILVPVLQQGTYYLMASASTTNRTPQQITLLAEIIDFEILHVNTASGTNTGSVTTKITGAKFDTIMDFRLTDANGYTPAQKVKFENSTNSYVTFNLTDLPAGTYNVEAELPGGIITMKEGAFVVEQGLPAELGVNIVAPSSVRVGNSTTVNIEYGNNGSTDLNVSGFMVVSANGHPIGTTIDELAEGRDTITFSTAEPGMDPDIIRPNYFATKTIYVNASTTGMVSIYVYPIRRRYE